jgi:NAD-dependent SIR2 family protein deacetylase
MEQMDMTRINEKDIERAFLAAASAVESADALIIMAGAGIGVDSGLPDYRGDEGLWRAYPRLKELGMPFESAANPGWFQDDPAMAWAFYGHRQQLYLNTKPHHGFALLKQWGEAMKAGHYVYTSNVDGQFQIAGFDGARLVECHGNIHLYQCCEPCNDTIWQDRPKDLDIDLEELKARGPLPRCPECDEIARPNVMLFQDWDWIRDIRKEQEDGFTAWIETLVDDDKRVLIIEIGAGSTVPEVRRQTDRLLEQLNARLVRINPNEAEGPPGTISVPLPALEALERIETALSDEFKQDCQEIQDKLNEPPSQETIKNRIANYFKGNPGGIISTLSSIDLEVNKARKVYGKPCQITLPNGWVVWVDRLEMRRNYSGQLEGTPDKSHIQQDVAAAEQYVRENWYGPKTKVIKPNVYDASSERPVLPSLRFMARIECFEARNKDEDGTWLNLVWFADVDDEKSMKDYVEEALEQIDWEKEADSYWI